MLFSQRQGITPSKKPFQVEDIDEGLRNRLWNLIDAFFWEKQAIYRETNKSPIYDLCVSYWHDFFELTLDSLPSHIAGVKQYIRDAFFDFEWYRIYDFIDFTLTHGVNWDRDGFIDACNDVLDKDNAAYRIVSGHVSEITSPEEIDSIEEATSATLPFDGARAHFASALKHLTDRRDPDYRNSIKESISAVESAAQVLAGNKKATLGDALKEVEKHGTLHGAFKAGLTSLYGYTSDADGIRHAMLEESDVSFTDAKFMLVVCSAFVNYLVGKSTDLGIAVD